MKKITSLNLIIFLVLFCFFFIPRPGWAEFSITTTPLEGGNDLVFRASPGAIAEPREVRIKIATDQAKQYEVRQELLSIPNNGRGDNIALENFLFRGLRGTNAYGTFQAASTVPLPLRSVNPIYTSNTGGSLDEFVLVYNLDVPLGTPSGEYRGQIRFVLQPLSGGLNQNSVFLNIVVMVGTGPTLEAKPLIEILSVTGSKTLRLNSGKVESNAIDVEIKINGRFKNLFSIIQTLTKPLESNEGNRLDPEAVNCQVSAVRKGMGMPLKPLTSGQETIYTSGPSGEVDDHFIITYSLGDLSGQKAGMYISNIQYYLEEVAQPIKPLASLGLEIENERIFELIINPEDQKGTIEFRSLKPLQAPKRNEIIIEIKSNVGKRYQVSQNAYSQLTDKEGHVITNKYFTLVTESLDTKGSLKALEKQEVGQADTVLFVSDAQGSSDKFKIIYELSVPLDVIAGDYSSRITYSLLEI